MNFLSSDSIIYYIAMYAIAYIVFIPIFITVVANVIRKIMYDKEKQNIIFTAIVFAIGLAASILLSSLVNFVSRDKAPIINDKRMSDLTTLTNIYKDYKERKTTVLNVKTKDISFSSATVYSFSKHKAASKRVTTRYYIIIKTEKETFEIPLSDESHKVVIETQLRDRNSTRLNNIKIYNYSKHVISVNGTTLR